MIYDTLTLYRVRYNLWNPEKNTNSENIIDTVEAGIHTVSRKFS